MCRLAERKKKPPVPIARAGQLEGVIDPLSVIERPSCGGSSFNADKRHSSWSGGKCDNDGQTNNYYFFLKRVAFASKRNDLHVTFKTQMPRLPTT